MPYPPLLASDVDHILSHTEDIWRDLRGARFFITGGTGFYGKWLLESIAAANDRLNTRVKATILSRNPIRFNIEAPRLAARPEFKWLVGDTADFKYPNGQFDYVLHFATASASEISAGGPTLTMATLLGTQRVLQFARSCHAKRLLLTSSGAVYGQQPAELSHIPETFNGAPNPQHASSAYGEIKRLSELMCALTPEVECVITRGFSFFGPGLPLNEKFAIGSFIRDAIKGGPIRIHGDGTPIRSYLYGSDLAIWLLTLLIKGKPNLPYNVGSDHAVNLRNLAKEIATTYGNTDIDVALTPVPQTAEIYVPNIDRAKKELGLEVVISRHEGLIRTIDWTLRGC